MALTQIAGSGVGPAPDGCWQPSLWGASELSCRSITARPVALDPTTSVLYQPNWVAGDGELFDVLRSESPWRATERPMYDRVVAVPRLICTLTMGDLDRTHPLSRVTHSLERELGVAFDRVGLNYYRSGQDSVAWHRDAIGRTGRPAMVALVSLGSARPLRMRPVSGSGGRTHSWNLGNGDLFLMWGAAQRNWEHCVPKQKQAGPRISIAYRSGHAVAGVVGGDPPQAAQEVTPLGLRHKLQ